MNPSSLYEMRHSIVQAVSDYVDIEAEELVEVSTGLPAPSPACIGSEFPFPPHLPLQLLSPAAL